MPSFPAALLPSSLAALLALASWAGAGPLTVGLILVIAVFGFGAVGRSGQPGGFPAGFLAVTTGTVAALAVLRTGTEERAAAVVPVLAIAVVAAVAMVTGLLLREGGREGLVDRLTLTVSASAAAALPAYWVAMRQDDSGPTTVAIVIVAAGVAAAATAGRLPPVRAGTSLAAAAGPALALVGGVVAGWLTLLVAGPESGVSHGAGLALACVGTLAALGTIAATAALLPETVEPANGGGVPSGVRLALVATLPFIAPAPVAYVVARLAVG